MGALDGKVAAITGASSGIGDAIARSLSSEGASVVLGARREDRLKSLASDINDGGGKTAVIPVDVTDQQQAEDFVNGAAEEFGGLDIMVNNAGVMLLGPVMGADKENWERMIDVNIKGVLWCTHPALPLMEQRGGGHIVNVSSVAGRRAGAFAAVYNFTKFGLTGFSEALRQEALNIGVRVTAIEPGFVDTELASHNNEQVQEAAEEMMEKIGEILQPEDIAEAVRFAVTSPQRMNVSEVLVMPTGQK
ncbi:MAG: SDR family oxidoreductase [Solirubrobacterales bacterium]